MMGAVKSWGHDQLEALRFIDEEWPHYRAIHRKFAVAIAEHLCASDRAKGEQYVMAAAVIPIFADELDRWTDTSNLDARVARVEQAVFPGETNA